MNRSTMKTQILIAIKTMSLRSFLIAVMIQNRVKIMANKNDQNQPSACCKNCIDTYYASFKLGSMSKSMAEETPLRK